ncbi:MAG: DUF1800 domain-containing protein [Sphingobacteriia bacterium]|nr:MAG: DUF1800 domain-containing protein [Sphingobacteriia bacterium]
MNLSRTLKSLSVGVSLTLLLSFSNKDGNYAEQSVKMPYKKYGYTDAQAAARLLDRFSFGASPGQVNEVVKMGLDNWFEQQLQGKLPDDKVNDRLANFKTLSLNNETIVNTYMNAGQVVRFAVKNGLINRDTINGDKKEYQQQVRTLMLQQGFKPLLELQGELINQKILRAAYSNNQLHEVLTDFWFNHFNVSITKPQCQQFITTYERDAIRPNVTGNFETLLMATAKHPAMLEYLDNASSVSNSNKLENKKVNAKVNERLQEKAEEMMSKNTPGAAFAQQAVQVRKAQGLNENYAREIMELHTLGVDGGYTQADVTSVARTLTGWSIFPLVKDAPGRALIDRVGVDVLTKRGFVVEGDFLFRADKHDDEPKTILGKSFPENGGYKEGEAVIKMLVNHSSTAKFICNKLATRFVSDTPSVSLVKNMTTTFEQTNGNIKAVLIAMVNHADFWNQKITREKIKSPFELVISAVRATNAEVNQPMQLFNWCNRMGQKLYFYQAPTGFPDRASYWINTGALLNRMNFGLAFAAQKIPGIQLNLPALNQNHEPESTTDALKVYSNLLLPERDHTANIARLSAMVNDGKVAKKIDAAAAKIVPAQATEIMEEEMMPRGKKGGDKQAWSKKNIPFELLSAMGNNTMIAQVAGIIIGSPEFQRK